MIRGERDVPAPNGEVWVVDDSPTQARLAEHILAPHWKVVRFGSGVDALARLDAGDRPDLVVLDWNLPEVSGREVCERIRRRFDESMLPILVLTGEEGPGALVQALEAGANDFVRKPPSAAELVARATSLGRVRLVGAVGEVLTSTMDEAEALRRLAALLVPHHADALFVHLGDGVAAPTLALAWPDASDAEHARAAACALEALATCHGCRSSEAGSLDLACAPLLANGTPLGALTIGTRGGDRPLAERHEALLSNVARRLAAAIDKARLFALALDARQRAEEANLSKDQFVAVVSHELRNPLNAIVGWASLLCGDTVTVDQRRRGLETILRNARLQVQMVDDLLDLTRVTAGKLQLEPTWVEPGSLVELAVETARPVADARKITIDATVDPADKIWADADRLQQVVANLLSNAIKFTPEGGRIEVDLADERDGVVVRVTDSGTGIDPGFLPFVFDRFKQSDASSTRSHGGLGLGLSIVKHIVEQHEGTIVALSEGRGRGATFEMRLPRREGSRRTVRPVQEALRAPIDRPQLRGARVLVVDDEKDSREMLATLLGGAGMTVEAVPSAAAGLTALAETRFDVVVSDISMPGEDGLSFISKLRATSGPSARTRAVALTSLSGQDDRRRALTAGFDLHVPKPVDLDELLIVLQRMIELGEAQRSSRG